MKEINNADDSVAAANNKNLTCNACTTLFSAADGTAAAAATRSGPPQEKGMPTEPKPRTPLPPFRVQFSRKTRVYLIPTLDEYTDEEIDAAWITEEEEIASKRDLIKTIEVLRRNNGKIPKSLEDSQMMTARGIERLADQSSAAQHKAFKLSHIDAILDAQDESCAPQEIAKISETISEAARDRARGLGALDEQRM